MFKSPENFNDYITYEALELINRPYTELFSVKDELIIELITNEIFHGEVLEAGENRIEITNVKQLHTGNKLSGTYSFYKNEIANIRHLKQVKETTEPVQECKNIKIDKDEYYRLIEMTKNCVYIEESCLLHPAYCEALDVLSSAAQIGVAAPGILGRDAIIPLLVLSTWKDIYIFDTSKLVPPYFLPKMNEIFKSENICKVIHKGGPLLDILRRYYNIESNYIFDTELVDIMIQKSKDPEKEIVETRNVFQCLEAYLKFPPSLNENFKVKANKWTKRPLKESKRVYASQLVVYLITLKETLNDILFSDLHETVDNFCDFYSRITTDFDYSVIFNIKELTPAMQELITDFSTFSVK